MTEAPNLPVTLSDGRVSSIHELVGGSPLALVFVRHLGCIFCREQVAQLRDFSGRLVFVGQGTPEQTREFRDTMRSPQDYICDPGRVVFDAFGLRRGRVGQLMNLATIKRGFSAMRSGHGQSRPVGDPMVLGGTFIVGPGGPILWEHRSQTAADFPSPNELSEALASVSV